MYFPTNPAPRKRPTISLAESENLSERMTRGLQAIQERERNHAALVVRAAEILPTLEV